VRVVEATVVIGAAVVEGVVTVVVFVVVVGSVEVEGVVF